MVAEGVAIDDPIELAVVQNYVGVAILRNERSDIPDAIRDITAQQNTAARNYILRHQQIDVAVIEAKEQPPPEAADVNALIALIEVRDVVVAARVVELRGQRVDDTVNVRLFAVIDSRLR